MKLLTLNTHSLIGEDFYSRAETFLSALVREKPDVIALQEVNQHRNAPLCSRETLQGFIPCQTQIAVKEDNYSHWLWEGLKKNGMNYFWTWLPVKLGYSQYDEGLAFFCRQPIEDIEIVPISYVRDYYNWKTRMALIIRPKDSEQWFCNLHMGWWEDREEPFSDQWNRLSEALKKKHTVWLMGDFNNPAERRGEGYDQITSFGFYDSYLFAREISGNRTICGKIDGWRGIEAEDQCLRIDQIWCNKPIPICSYRTLFDGRQYHRVSDHFGVMVTTEETTQGGI